MLAHSICLPLAHDVRAHDALRGMLLYLERLKSKGPAACVSACNLERLVLVAVILANKCLDRTQRTAGCFAGGSLAVARVLASRSGGEGVAAYTCIAR